MKIKVEKMKKKIRNNDKEQHTQYEYSQNDDQFGQADSDDDADWDIHAEDPNYSRLESEDEADSDGASTDSEAHDVSTYRALWCEEDDEDEEDSEDNEGNEEDPTEEREEEDTGESNVSSRSRRRQFTEEEKQRRKELKLETERFRQMSRDGWDFDMANYPPNLENYPNLYDGPSGPVQDLLQVAESPRALFFYFMPKKLWRTIAYQSNLYRKQQLGSRVAAIKKNKLD